MSEEKVEVVRRMFDAFNRGDVETVVAAFDEGCQLHEPPEMPDTPAEGFRGHQGIREWMANLRETGGIQFEGTSFTTSDDLVFSEWIGSGRGQGSGVPINWRTFAVVHVHDGRIVRLQAFLDRDQALEAAGLRE
jgi:ketosteroid isomerase-like protein